MGDSLLIGRTYKEWYTKGVIKLSVIYEATASFFGIHIGVVYTG